MADHPDLGDRFCHRLPVRQAGAAEPDDDFDRERNGAYYAYAKRYAELLAANGITLEIQTSAGSVENLERVKKGDADIAFIQGGIQEELEDNDESSLRSLGSVAFEPVWVFYRNEYRLDKLYQLSDRRIAVGEEGSGIRGLALQLLEANEISTKGKNLLPVAPASMPPRNCSKAGSTLPSSLQHRRRQSCRCCCVRPACA